jgi:hypothetical protein
MKTSESVAWFRWQSQIIPYLMINLKFLQLKQKIPQRDSNREWMHMKYRISPLHHRVDVWYSFNSIW